MKEIRVSMDEFMFRGLVAGLIVKVPVASTCCITGGSNKVQVLITLQDIGFDRIREAVRDAMEKAK